VIQKSQILQQFDALSPAAQRQVAAFIAFLSAQQEPSAARTTSSGSLRDEEFVGLWAEREDLRDSGEWVRRLRNTEWER